MGKTLALEDIEGKLGKQNILSSLDEGELLYKLYTSSNDPFMILLDVFNYGKIRGKQIERANKKNKKTKEIDKHGK